MPTVREWLASIGMSEYAELFSTNRIDFAVLPDLTDHDLERLGVVLGDRRKILRAIRELGEASETAQPRVGAELQLHDAAERRQLSVVFIDLVVLDRALREDSIQRTWARLSARFKKPARPQ